MFTNNNAEMCLKHPSTIVDELLAEPAPKRLPPEPISEVAATIRLKLGERAASGGVGTGIFSDLNTALIIRLWSPWFRHKVRQNR